MQQPGFLFSFLAARLIYFGPAEGKLGKAYMIFLQLKGLASLAH